MKKVLLLSMVVLFLFNSTHAQTGDPLILVNNCPYNGKIEDIDPATVESIAVLKGNRACYGGTREVIVITLLPNLLQEKTNKNDIRKINHHLSSVLKLSPNPARKRVRVSLSRKNYYSNVDIDLVNLQGQIIKSWRRNFLSNSNSNELDIHDIIPGIYLIRIKTSKGNKAAKLLIE